MIDIVLATYNGEAFIAQQIKSIQDNTGYQTWINQIIVSDDGSTDNTQKIVAKLAQKDSKIVLLNNTTTQHGPKGNFEFGLLQSNADYIMLCDQDDVWLPHKIQTSITALLHAEKMALPDTPVLMFSDKLIVDEQLQIICNSYFTLKKISKNWHVKFSQLCQQNVVSGCTMLFNRALINKALPIPEKAYMHDWWLALVAHRCGEIVFIDKPLIQYRQHKNNAIGARKRTFFSLCTKFTEHFTAFKVSQQAIIEQAIVFKEFEQKNKMAADTTIDILSCFNELPLHKKIIYFYNRDVTRSHLLGRLALLISLLKTKYQ